MAEQLFLCSLFYLVMPGKQLYFIAIVPPEPFREKAWKLKEHFRDRYNSKASLNSPPHITLFPPFKLAREEKELVSALEEQAKQFHPFMVSLENFGAFPPRVIYIDVLPQPEMEKLQQAIKELIPQFAQPDPKVNNDRPFHPHMTLAFRDLSKEQFRKAWKEFNEEELSYSWEVESFTLLRHNGKHWEEKQEIQLHKTAPGLTHL